MDYKHIVYYIEQRKTIGRQLYGNWFLIVLLWNWCEN